MNKRLKEVREALSKEGKKYTQTDIAKALDISRDMVATYESGRVVPNSLFVSSFCRKYGVNEEWLRNGSGEMFTPSSREREIAQITAELFHGEDSNFKRELVSYIIRSSPEQLEMIKDMIWELSKTIEKDHD